MAKEAGMSLQEYWQQVIEGCYLDKPDPVGEWKRIQAELNRVKTALNALVIQRVHVEAEGIDLWVTLGKDRQWLGGSGRNIPSYELFISPDWRGTEGVIRFNQPLYRFGNLVKDVELEFKAGRVVRAAASEGEDFLKAMIARENADKIGEFSLTDRRISRITRFMADTLFDENMGGPFGNTHVAVGKAYKDSYAGDQFKPTKAEWEAMGFNDSPEHTDIVSTIDRTVTAELQDGSSRVIFRDGQFTV
jgi:aminopeptidase